MRIKLKQLLKGISGIVIKGSKEIDIIGLCNNSKFAAPGYLFFAKKGSDLNGNQFIQEAALAGVSCIATDLFDPFLKNITQIICSDVRELEANLADRFYDYPSRQLLSIAITGTNGKTTTSYLLKYLLDRIGYPAGLIGTIQQVIGEAIFPAHLTTPDIITNQKLFREMVNSGCKSAVMEVSSHGLDQGRVATIDFDLAIFTNLTQDHLDYHQTMEEYAEAKARLFRELGKKSSFKKPYPKVAILNCDSPWWKKMGQECSALQMTYGLSEYADVRAENIQLDAGKTQFQVSYLGEKLFLTTSLIGLFNVYNCLAVIAAALSLGFEFAKILEVISTFKAVPGRLERVENLLGKNIFVDYAHTEDALQNVLSSLKEVAKGKVLCVFGCGGNRDKLKRPKMGAVVTHLADKVFVTSDNPRGESPESIIQEILLGISEKDSSKVCIEVDRRKAIEKAVSDLEKEDILLIAGKGHENYQIFSHHTIHFDDRIVAKEYCQ